MTRTQRPTKDTKDGGAFFLCRLCCPLRPWIGGSLSTRQVNHWSVPFSDRGDFEELRGSEAKTGGEQVRRELLLRRVEVGRDVVVELPCEAHLVLRRRQLFLQHLDVVVRLKRRVILGDREQPAERLRQL